MSNSSTVYNEYDFLKTGYEARSADEIQIQRIIILTNLERCRTLLTELTNAMYSDSDTAGTENDSMMELEHLSGQLLRLSEENREQLRRYSNMVQPPPKGLYDTQQKSFLR